MNMLLLILTHFIVSMSPAIAEEVKADTDDTPQVNVDKNANGVLPSYVNMDNANEKSKKFSWGTVFYSSVTREDDHKHASNNQTQLNIRYECNDAKSKNSNIQRFSFCGYAKSEIDTNARNLEISELKKMPEHKSKTEAQLIALYDKEYNDRIVDPLWNILDKSSNGKTSVEITVRQNAALYGTCEEKISNISIPVDCK